MSAAGGILALGAAGALGEIAARAAIRRWSGYYRYVPWTRKRVEIDREALPALAPIADIEINCDGERGDPPPREGENAYRVLVVGGSAAECFFLRQHETWSAVVQRILARPENARALGVDRVHVGNVARSILPASHVHVLLRKILPRYRRLDLVLAMVGASDVVRWLEQGMPHTLADEAPDLAKIFEQRPDQPWSFHPRRSALWRLAGAIDRRLRRPVARVPNGGSWMHRARAMRAQAKHVIDEVPDATVMLDGFGRHLAALIRTAQEKAARVILVRQPWLAGTSAPDVERSMWSFALGRPYHEQVDTYASTRVVDGLMRLVDARAAAVAGELGIEQVDLMPRLERSARTFYDDLHFTPAGAEQVADLVAEAILRGHEARMSVAEEHAPREIAIRVG